MAHLTFAEKFELGAILVVIALAGWLAPRPRLSLEAGEWLASAALLVLLQGFCRDLWLLRQARRRPAPPTRAARCLCVESALGLTGVVAGIGLVGLGLDRPVSLSATGLAAGVGADLAIGYLLKDFVFEWSPWRIYREKNHAQLLWRWGK